MEDDGPTLAAVLLRGYFIPANSPDVLLELLELESLETLETLDRELETLETLETELTLEIEVEMLESELLGLDSLLWLL